jgi:prepilin-type N-terminal cleavage/methylation domain-containing protein
MLTKIRNTKRENGFSLLELAVAVGIAAIVAAVGVTASTVFVNGSQTKADDYQASADSEITNAKASFDALWGEAGAPEGNNNGNNEPEPEVSPFPITFNDLDMQLSTAGSFWSPSGDTGFNFDGNLQLLFDNVSVGHYIEFVNNNGGGRLYTIDLESDFFTNINGSLYSNPLLNDGWATTGGNYIETVILHGPNNPLAIDLTVYSQTPFSFSSQQYQFGDQLYVALPAEAENALNIFEGDNVTVTFSNGAVLNSMVLEAEVKSGGDFDGKFVIRFYPEGPNQWTGWNEQLKTAVSIFKK